MENRKEFTFPSADGKTAIHAVEWHPAGEPAGILQIAHGVAEYALRYEPFARFLNAHGFLVVANDHLGHGESVAFSVDPREIKPLIYTPNSYIVEFDFDGKKEQAVLREAQFHPVREQILHLDFYRIADGKPVSIAIPVRLTGNAEGVKVGGKLALSARKLVVSALVENLPDELVVDVTTLGVGKTIFVGDLKFENLKFVTPATTAVCAVRVTRASRGAAAQD